MLMKYVTTNASGDCWFTMHDTPEQAFRDMENDKSGMIAKVMRWVWAEYASTGHRIYQKTDYTSVPIGAPNGGQDIGTDEF